MTKIVIAGASDCPYYANVELLADKLAANLPNFIVTKIVKRDDEWKAFASELASANKWPVLPSPIIWRELVDRGGKGTLIGGANAFQEYAYSYYGEFSKLTTQDLNRITRENRNYKEQDIEIAEKLNSKYSEAKKIAIIGADSPTAVHLLMLFTLRGHVEPKNELNIHLYTDEVQNRKILNSIRTQIEDCSCSSIIRIEVEDNMENLLRGAHIIITLDVVPREYLSNSESGDSLILEARNIWLTRRYAYFYNLGKKILELCGPYVKILVAGSPKIFKNAEVFAAPINFDVMSLYMACKERISTRNIVGLVKPLEWRLRAAIASQIKVRCCDIVNLIVWGNVDNRFYVDYSQTRVYRRHGKFDAITGPAWFSIELQPLLWNTKWLQEELMSTALKTLSSPNKFRAAMCQASAILDCISQWNFNQIDSEKMISSLVMISEGEYDVPKGIAFSFPVTCNPEGCFAVVDNIPFDETKSTAITKCIKDTLEDWSAINPVPLERFLISQPVVQPPSISGHPNDDATLDIPAPQLKT